jgi:hypothetical protein
MAVGAAGAGAEGFLLGEVKHRFAEIGPLNAGIAEVALHEHGVAEDGTAQICCIKAACKGHHVGKVGIAEIGLTQVAGIEHGAAQVSVMQIEADEIGLEKLLLVEVAAMLIRIQILEAALTSQLRCRYRKGGARLQEWAPLQHD